MPASAHSFELIGVGSPIMDLLAQIPDTFLTTLTGAKGGMVLVDAQEMEAIVTRLENHPATVAGGSAGNTAVSAARLGIRTTFLGKLGNDATARAYKENFAHAGGDVSRFKYADLANARCVSLITPDAARTMRTCLGAAMTLAAGEISPADFHGCRHAHIEGYLLFNRDLANAVITAARAAGCTISIDLASFEVVNAARDWILAQLHHGIDIVFANEDEIHALFPAVGQDYPALAKRLAEFGGLAAVKIGKDGAWIAKGTELHRILPVPAPTVIDTTGAGDAWAAGFLYGYLRGWTPLASGALGSRLGSECVRHLGPAIPAAQWPAIHAEAAKLSG
ncbi:adenosine kinase [Rariglobus hedericola]|uniref:Adenosine kinase n=1 Tax=Rariglobus hedericola TaxID=2597822 RepID=A0A556QRD1_9BACT|nr:adenosine kinase [Rariglobus hedericola]TSJ79191.1 adenosine kinase [Rariglobus hedericola]